MQNKTHTHGRYKTKNRVVIFFLTFALVYLCFEMCYIHISLGDAAFQILWTLAVRFFVL